MSMTEFKDKRQEITEGASTSVLQGFLTVHETSIRLGRCPEVVRRYVREGKLPARKLGLMWYIRPEDADALARKLSQ